MTATILVVDDEETARMVVSEFLRTKGYEVQEAGTLAEARAFWGRMAQISSSWMCVCPMAMDRTC